MSVIMLPTKTGAREPKYWEDLVVGAHHTEKRLVTYDMIAAFAKVTGDTNPLHVDYHAARAAGFENCIAHGQLMLGLVSKVLGMDFPVGPGTIYVSSHADFRRPVFAGTTVEIHTILAAKRMGRYPAVDVSVVVRQHGVSEPKNYIEGSAHLRVPSRNEKRA